MNHLVMLKFRPDEDHSKTMKDMLPLLNAHGVRSVSVGKTFTTQRANGYTHGCVGCISMHFVSRYKFTDESICILIHSTLTHTTTI